MPGRGCAIHAKLTARHEAGHVLGYLAADVPFERVLARPHLAPAMGRWGPTLPLRPTQGGVHGGELRCDLWTGAVILWCGPLAEGGYHNAGDDLMKIRLLDRRWIADRSPSSPWIAARELLDGYWLELGRLTAALLERGELSYEECRAVCGFR